MYEWQGLSLVYMYDNRAYVAGMFCSLYQTKEIPV